MDDALCYFFKSLIQLSISVEEELINTTPEYKTQLTPYISKYTELSSSYRHK